MSKAKGPRVVYEGRALEVRGAGPPNKGRRRTKEDRVKELDSIEKFIEENGVTKCRTRWAKDSSDDSSPMADARDRDHAKRQRNRWK